MCVVLPPLYYFFFFSHTTPLKLKNFICTMDLEALLADMDDENIPTSASEEELLAAMQIAEKDAPPVGVSGLATEEDILLELLAESSGSEDEDELEMREHLSRLKPGLGGQIIPSGVPPFLNPPASSPNAANAPSQQPETYLSPSARHAAAMAAEFTENQATKGFEVGSVEDSEDTLEALLARVDAEDDVVEGIKESDSVAPLSLENARSEVLAEMTVQMAICPPKIRGDGGEKSDESALLAASQALSAAALAGVAFDAPSALFDVAGAHDTGSHVMNSTDSVSGKDKSSADGILRRLKSPPVRGDRSSSKKNLDDDDDELAGVEMDVDSIIAQYSMASPLPTNAHLAISQSPPDHANSSSKSSSGVGTNAWYEEQQRNAGGDSFLALISSSLAALPSALAREHALLTTGNTKMVSPLATRRNARHRLTLGQRIELRAKASALHQMSQSSGIVAISTDLATGSPSAWDAANRSRSSTLNTSLLFEGEQELEEEELEEEEEEEEEESAAIMQHSRRNFVASTATAASTTILAAEIDFIGGPGSSVSAAITGHLHNGRFLVNQNKSNAARALVPPSLIEAVGGEEQGSDSPHTSPSDATSSGAPPPPDDIGGDVDITSPNASVCRSTVGILSVEILTGISSTMSRALGGAVGGSGGGSTPGSASMGSVTCLSVHARFIAVGTSRSVVCIFDRKDQQLRCCVSRLGRGALVGGSPSIAAAVATAAGGEDGPVTCVETAPTQDFFLVGYASGRVVLFDAPENLSRCSPLKTSEQHTRPITACKLTHPTLPHLLSIDAVGNVYHTVFSKVMGLRWSFEPRGVLEGGNTGEVLSCSVLLPPVPLQYAQGGGRRRPAAQAAAALPAPPPAPPTALPFSPYPPEKPPSFSSSLGLTSRLSISGPPLWTFLPLPSLTWLGPGRVCTGVPPSLLRGTEGPLLPL